MRNLGLIAHLHSDSDYFVTNNTLDFINATKDNLNRDGSYKNLKKRQLDELGIKVITPVDLIVELENKYGIK